MRIVLVLVLFSFCYSCRLDDQPAAVSPQSDETPIAIAEKLPMLSLDLKDLSAFAPTGDNWSIVGDVSCVFTEEWNIAFEAGQGILLNTVEDQNKRDMPADGRHIVTAFEHGDIELMLEVLVPKRSNSGLYFQGRYELQIRDSAEDPVLSADDMGGIYDQPTQNGQGGGVKPAINAARQAGLWQTLHILFRAPTFDASGQKMSNAQFEFVYLNGYKIHDHVEISSPTLEADENNEVPLAPLRIQGDHGPIAFRNMRYKLFGTEEISLDNLSYKVYDGKFDYIPDFSKMQPIKAGNAENFDNLTDIAGKNDGFCMVFEGELTVPYNGVYLFETSIDDGGDLFIDDRLIVHNQGEPGGGVERDTVTLSKGRHALRQTYYQDVWGAGIALHVEGPNLEKSELPKRIKPRELPSWMKQKTMPINVGTTTELIRGFVDHRGVKKTHVLSVGTPAGLHYSYDTRHNELLNVWKGGFGDVGEMWINRGESQRFQALSAVLGMEPNGNSANCRPGGYQINTQGYPVFEYRCGEAFVVEQFSPVNEGLQRTISIKGESMKNYVIASADDNIQKLANDWYSIGNQYYLRPVGAATNWRVEGNALKTDLLPEQELAYILKW